MRNKLEADVDFLLKAEKDRKQFWEKFWLGVFYTAVVVGILCLAGSAVYTEGKRNGKAAVYAEQAKERQQEYLHPSSDYTTGGGWCVSDAKGHFTCN